MTSLPSNRYLTVRTRTSGAIVIDSCFGLKVVLAVQAQYVPLRLLWQRHLRETDLFRETHIRLFLSPLDVIVFGVDSACVRILHIRQRQRSGVLQLNHRQSIIPNFYHVS